VATQTVTIFEDHVGVVPYGAVWVDAAGFEGIGLPECMLAIISKEYKDAKWI